MQGNEEKSAFNKAASNEISVIVEAIEGDGWISSKYSYDSYKRFVFLRK